MQNRRHLMSTLFAGILLIISFFPAQAVMTCPTIQTAIDQIAQLKTLTAPIQLTQGYYYSGNVALNNARIDYYTLNKPTAVFPTLQVKLLAAALTTPKFLNIDNNELHCIYLGDMQDSKTPIFNGGWDQVIMISTSLPPAALPLTIKQVSSTQETGANYSLQIEFKTAYVAINNWAIGFSMPRTFEQLVTSANAVNINPDLEMQVCNANNSAQCFPMKLVKTDSPYLMAGTTSIFAPVDPTHQLVADTDYILQLNHTNQWAPANYTAMPQSFFLIENNNQIVPLTDLVNSQYKIDGYDANQVAENITSHIQTNWDNSLPPNKASLADQYNLVPTPTSMVALKGQALKFPNNNEITFSDEFNDPDNQAMLQNFFHQQLHRNLISLKSNAANNAFIRIKKTAFDNPEAYRVTIDGAGILIEASTTTGYFYGAQTLKQLISQSPLLVPPSVVITDAPRYKYRGILLDVARHYISVDDIEKLIDVMAEHKLNTLHMHFSDDEAWRLDVSATPNDPLVNLVAIGGTRGFTAGSILPPELLPQANLDISNYSSTGKLINPNYLKATDLYSRFYTTDDIKTIVGYANKKHITVIPEIDLPGHSRALIYSLPDIFKDQNDHSKFVSVQGYTDDVIPVCLYAGTSKQAQAFTTTLNQTINRINDLFANQSTLYYQAEVSIGGDEVASTAWTDDSSCQGNWAPLSALNKSQYFFSLIPAQVNSLLLSGWQQVVQQDDGSLSGTILPPAKLSHIWVWQPSGATTDQQGIKAAATLINAGYPTVLAFADNTYFDLTYSPDEWEPGYYWAGNFLDTNAALQSAANATRVENLVNTNALENLLGIEGTLWTENMPNFQHVIYMALPKMAGLAEAAWSSSAITNVNGQVNWQSLATRLGKNNIGFLNYLYMTYGVIYRGYPQGIVKEVPKSSMQRNI